MCEYGNNKQITVKISADLSHTGKSYYKEVGIDSCIAYIVCALQDKNINMLGSCCGHFKNDGEIILEDVRILIIKRV